MKLNREEDRRFLASLISVECPWISTTMEAVTWHIVHWWVACFTLARSQICSPPLDKSAVVVHMCNLSSWEGEAAGSEIHEYPH